MLLEAIFPLLKTFTEFTNVVNGGIHIGSLPEGACRTAVSYMAVGGSGDPTFETSGMQKARVQFDAFGETRKKAAKALDLLRQQLDGYQGTLSNGLYIDNVDLLNPEPIDFPVEEYARDFRCMSEYYFYFTFT